LDINIITPLLAAIAGVIAGVAGAVVSLRRLPIERRTAETEANAALAKTYSDLVCDLRDELTRVHTEQRQLRNRIVELEKRDRAHLDQIDMLRKDLLDEIKLRRKTETKVEQLTQLNHDLVNRLAESDEKRRLLEEKLDNLIKNGQGGQGG